MHRKLAAATIALFTLVAGGPAGAESLHVGGTGGAIDMMRHVGAAFTAAEGIRLEIALSLGSSGALRALGDGALDVAVAARPLWPEENKSGLVIVPVARTALVFATSHRNPNSLRRAELAPIYASPQPAWADGSPLRIILRTRLDADTEILSDVVPGMREAFAAARERKDVPVAATDQDNTKLAETMPGALMFGGLSQLELEKRDLRYVTIDGVKPSLATFESGAYPYEKTFYLVFPRDRSPKAQRFLDFVRSAPGRAALRASGTLPVSE
jgi:phosphate transport system substrate-binding protein